MKEWKLTDRLSPEGRIMEIKPHVIKKDLCTDEFPVSNLYSLSSERVIIWIISLKIIEHLQNVHV